jgi:glycine cleavage system aminomethyltransferase T
VLGERDGTPVVAHYGSVAAEIAVCVKAAGLVERWDVRQLALTGRERLLERVLASAFGQAVPAPGRAISLAGTWCCRIALDRAIVAGSPAAVDRWQRVMREAGRTTGAGVSAGLAEEAAALSIVGPHAAEVMAAAGLPGPDLSERGVATGLLAGCRTSVLREEPERFLLLCPDGCTEAARDALWQAGDGLGLAHVGCDALERLSLAHRTDPGY